MREHRLICFSRIKASLLNYDTDSISGFDVEQHERLQNTDRVLGTGHYVRRGRGEGRRGRVKAISDWQFDRMVYFKRGSLAKMGKADKQ